ncbi:MAG: hypothetical protein ACREQB_00035 [Candidatus Binataceae bacterium]
MKGGDYRHVQRLRRAERAMADAERTPLAPPGEAATLLAAHVAAGDPHPVYLTQAEAGALYAPKLAGYTVAGLPAGTVGATAYVTNALLPVFGVAVVGGGAVAIPVFYNGAAWIVG